MRKLQYFFAAIFAFLLVAERTFAENLPFDMDLWKQMRQEKEENKFEERVIEKSEEEQKGEKQGKAEKKAAPKKPQKIAIELPAESRLSVSGRKIIDMKFGKVFYAESDPKKRTISAGGIDGLNMDQQLQIKIKGRVGEKIDVNIDYDDKQPDLNRRKISIVYHGNPSEFIQNIQFGDIKLSLPGTEFVGYSGKAGLNKNLFGFMGTAKYKKLNFYFVGSQTKGKSEIKKFTGSTSFVKHEIPDASYQSRKYYKIYFSTAQIPIVKGSEKIYLDDKIGTNNETGITQEMNVVYWSSTNTVHGNFDLLKPGIDYVIDYSAGIITFYKPIQKNYDIAVDWQGADGKILSDVAGYPVLIKDENELSSYDYEIKNRYFLGDTNIIRDPQGEKFVVKILDNSNSETDSSGKKYIDYLDYDVDYELGIIEFNDAFPFEKLGNILGENYSDTYDSDNRGQKQHFSIYVEYRVKLNTYLLRPNIVKDSERIVLDGTVLARDTDYIIDYYSGWITFLNTDKIKDDSTLEATYEYYPFIGGQEQTLVGSRLEFRPSGNFFLGGTMLYNFSPSVGKIPNIYQTSPSTLLLDANTKLTINPKKYFPFRISVSGEVASSDNNPNRAGKAIIENMEGIKLKDGYSTYEENWQPAAIQNQKDRGTLNWIEEENIKKIDINSSYYNDYDETTALDLNYSDMKSTASEVSIVYPISAAGADYSKKQFLEGYFWGDGKGETLTIELGQFNEDADGDDVLDTEDKNNDGFLNEDEDVGVPFNLPDGTTFYWGTDNGKIDTEDLDGDGILKTGEVPIFSTSTIVNWSGWQKKVFDLRPYISASKDSWRSVKQIKITLKKGSSPTGQLKISELGAVGDKWDEPSISGGSSEDSFEIKAINNEDDSEYASEAFLNTSYYEDLYNPPDTEIREQALKITYNLSGGATGWTYATYSRMDISIYKEINFFARGENSGNEIFLRFGTDDKNYYEYSFTDNFSGWKKFAISLEDNNYDKKPDGFQKTLGKVSLNNITKIYIGVRSNQNPASGEIWINDIYVDNAMKEKGFAMKGTANIEIPGWMKINGSARKIDSNFRSLTFASQSDQKIWNASVNFSRIRWLPLSGKIEKSVIKTPRENVNLSQAPMAQYLSFWDEGTVKKLSYSGNAALKIRHLPQISGDYTHSVTSASLQGKIDTADTYHGKVTYHLPNLLILPRNISCDYTRGERLTEYDLPGQYDVENLSEKYSGTAGFSFFRFLNFNGNYKLSRDNSGKRILKTKKTELLPQKQNVSTGVKGNLKFLKWLQFNFDYNAAIDENYKQPSSTQAWVSEGVKFKDINRKTSAGVSFPFSFRNLFNFAATNTLSLTYSTKLTDNDVYKDVDKDFYVLNKFFTRDNSIQYKPLTPQNPEAVHYSYATTKNNKISSSFKPFSFLNLKGMLTPVQTIDLQMNRTYNISKKEQTGTFSQSETTTWPDARMRISSLEKLPLFTSGFQNVNSLVEIQKTKKKQKNISLNTTQKRGITLNMKWRNLNINTSYKNSLNLNYNLQQDILAGKTRSQNWNLTVNFDPWEKWHSNITYSGGKKLGYASGDKLTADDRTHKLLGKLSSDRMRVRKKFHVPFSKREIFIDQNLRYNIDFSATAKLSRLNVDKNNYWIYASNFSLDFDISSNFRWKIGGGLSYADYTKRKENNYFAINISTRLEIIF
ncbi:MAG: hypothetical protein J7L54_06820 [Elusimicrobia bacterium]|nr:hypothetical protein [Elusimicrobiota bacterium]